MLFQERIELRVLQKGNHSEPALKNPKRQYETCVEEFMSRTFSASLCSCSLCSLALMREFETPGSSSSSSSLISYSSVSTGSKTFINTDTKGNNYTRISRQRNRDIIKDLSRLRPCLEIRQASNFLDSEATAKGRMFPGLQKTTIANQYLQGTTK